MNFGYWFLLLLGMIAFGGALANLFASNYVASTPFFLLAIVLILLAIAIKKGKP